MTKAQTLWTATTLTIMKRYRTWAQAQLRFDREWCEAKGHTILSQTITEQC